MPLPYPTNGSLEMNRRAAFLCEQMFKLDYQYKRAGIMLSEISPVTHNPGDLMETALADNLKLMEALDNLNARYVRGSVKVSTQGLYSGWQMKQDRKSPNYSTSWDDVPFV
jgi:DNA polymerase V